MKKTFSDGTSLPGWLLTVAVVSFLCVFQHPPAWSFLLTVEGVNRDGTANTAISAYRWVVEEDQTYHVPFDVHGNPRPDPNTLSVSFHRSYMPVVAQGDETTIGDLTLEPTRHYYVSVIPKAAGTYSIGGAAIRPGDTQATIYVNQLPLPAAQITIFVFEDNSPINNAPDLPEERGLAGFSIVLEDAGGRYGISAGTQTMDAFNNPLGTTYMQTCGPAGTDFCLDAGGAPIVLQMGDGTIMTDADGMATIKNLAPGKYGIQAVPPAGSDWVQTATIEGTKVIDAWVKAGEPPFFQEFGPAGWHVFVGFVSPTPRPANGTDPGNAVNSPAYLTGMTTITGRIVNQHLSRPPDYAFYNGASLEHTTPWVGLNLGAAGAGQGIFARRCNSDGTFAIPNVPAGSYQLVVWDDALDIIFAFLGVTVPASGDLALGEVPVFQWFTRQEHHVFLDMNANGFRDPDEMGIPEQAVNIRWRDGTVYQSFPTDGEGFVPFDEVFPFFAWQVAEVDFARFKATGVTVTVDDGGPIDPTNPWSWGGQLNPQPQFCTEADVVNPDDTECFLADVGTQRINPNTGDNLTRTEMGPVLLEGFQGFIGQTSVFEWGKAPYGRDENGGISGIVFYSTTRAENDPRYGFGEPWEPGIPRVQVNLYQDNLNNDSGLPGPDGMIDDINGSGATELADVDNYPFGDFPGPGDVDRNTNGVFDLGDAQEITRTDSWDDSLPTGCQGEAYIFHTVNGDKVTDCYDGLRNFNQVRPAVFDGGYAFGSAAGGDLPAGTYIVEAVPPPGYEIVKEEDKNVDFGEEYVPSPLLLPPLCVNHDENGGLGHLVPDELSLFPGVAGAFAGEYRPLCDRKQVFLRNGQNAAADFFLFTAAPIAGHIYGFILDDTANEFDPNAPTFGEKYAPP